MPNTKKKLLIIGNKMGLPSYNNYDIPLNTYIEHIESMDYVCRINRIHNYDITTGTKIDGLYLGGWNDFINQYKGGEHTDIIKQVKDVYVDNRAWQGGFKDTCSKFISQEQKDSLTVCTFEEQKKHINYPFPCSVLLMIDYFATTEPWCSEYEIYFTGIDVYNRCDVLSNEWQWKINGHSRGALFEQQYLMKMIAEGKIKWLEQELYKDCQDCEHVRILIPIKSSSKRCPYKNEILLPYTLDYLKKLNRLKDVVIISNGDCYRYLQKLYNVDYYVEQRKDNKNEFDAIKDFLDNVPTSKRFVWLPVTQPCRDDHLIDNVLNVHSDGLITSYITRPNRTIYKLDDNKQFIIKDSERKGVMCEDEYVADGAIYCMTKDFFYKVCQSDNKNLTFWNSNISFVENHAPLVDIDTKQDLLQFLKYYG